MLNPALVTQQAAQRLPRLALWLLCAAWVLPGIWGRDPWRNADLSAYGLMLSLAEGRSPWNAPELGGIPQDVALLPHWIGAWCIQALGSWVGPESAVRLPFTMALVFTLTGVWYATYWLARSDAAQPLSMALGGEADPKSYARALADGALLAFMATLGTLRLGHETTPELSQLCLTSIYLWGLASVRHRAGWAKSVALTVPPLLALCGAPMVATIWGALGVLISLSSRDEQGRRITPWIAVGWALAIGLSWWFDLWRWRLASHWTLDMMGSLVREWIWFLWPTLPLALWTTWPWRRSWARRHMALPVLSVWASLGASTAMGGNDRTLLLATPGLAILAAFALPTMKRSASAAIDWFSMILFSLSACFVWFMFAAFQTGWPPQPAANVARLAQGFMPEFEWLPFVAALGTTVAWIWLVRWRTARRRHPIWKSMVLPAAGVSMCWLLLMTLWMPLLDHARSLRPLVQQVQAVTPLSGCIVLDKDNAVLAAAFEVHAKVQVQRPSEQPHCKVLVHVGRLTDPMPDLPSWTLKGQTRRPTDRGERVLVFTRP